MCVAVVGGLGAGAILEGSEDRRPAHHARPPAVGSRAFAAGMAVVLIVPAVASVPGRFQLDRRIRPTTARAVAGRRSATALPQDAVIVSWWSYSTPLWYGQYVEGWRPDVTIIDDRTILDQNLGDAEQAVDDYWASVPST